MSDVLNSDELNALAAEYVLGTLDYEERKGASSLQEVDHAFRGLIRIWERRFGELHLMVEPVEPDPKVWERIKSKLGDQLPAAAFALENIPPASDTTASEAPTETPTLAAEPGASIAPEAPAEAASEPITQAPSISPAVETSPPDATAKLMRELEEASKLVAPSQPPTPSASPRRLIERDLVAARDEHAVLKRRRGLSLFAVLMSLIALVLAGLIGTWRFAPEMLPPQLSAITVLHIVDLTPPPLPPKRRSQPPAFDE